MSNAFNEICSTFPELLGRLLSAQSATRDNHNEIPQEPGVYLFSDEQRPRYVGQSRKLRSRLAQHTAQSGDRYSATLAFRIAIQQAREQGIPVDARTRDDLQADDAFKPVFTQAKRQVASWNLRFVEIEEPIPRTLFEVYVHLAPGTDLNDFETH